jgi:hypothetical protein
MLGLAQEHLDTYILAAGSFTHNFFVNASTKWASKGDGPKLSSRTWGPGALALATELETAADFAADVVCSAFAARSTATAGSVPGGEEGRSDHAEEADNTSPNPRVETPTARVGKRPYVPFPRRATRRAKSVSRAAGSGPISQAVSAKSFEGRDPDRARRDLTGLAGMYTVLNADGMCPLTLGLGRKRQRDLRTCWIS